MEEQKDYSGVANGYAQIENGIQSSSDSNPADCCRVGGTPRSSNLLLLLMVVCSLAPGFDIAKPLPSRTYNLPADGNIPELGLIRSNTTINVNEGGEIGDNFSAGASKTKSKSIIINVSGGLVGSSFTAFDGSFVNVSGGRIGDFFMAHSGSEINISGGLVGNRFCALHGSKVNVSGGEMQERFLAVGGSEVNISGGSFDCEFDAQSGSQINLFGTDFRLDGDPIEKLVIDQPHMISARGMTLTCTLADGSSFRYDLNSKLNPNDFCSPTAVLNVIPVADVPVSGMPTMHLFGLVGAMLLGSVIARNAFLIWSGALKN